MPSITAQINAWSGTPGMVQYLTIIRPLVDNFAYPVTVDAAAHFVLDGWCRPTAESKATAGVTTDDEYRALVDQALTADDPTWPQFKPPSEALRAALDAAGY